MRNVPKQLELAAKGAENEKHRGSAASEQSIHLGCSISHKRHIRVHEARQRIDGAQHACPSVVRVRKQVPAGQLTNN